MNGVYVKVSNLSSYCYQRGTIMWSNEAQKINSYHIQKYNLWFFVRESKQNQIDDFKLLKNYKKYLIHVVFAEKCKWKFIASLYGNDISIHGLLWKRYWYFSKEVINVLNWNFGIFINIY